MSARLRRAFDALAYLVAGLPLAALGLLAVVGLTLGAALGVVAIGLPLLLGSAAAARPLVRVDRRLANRLLDTHLPALPPAPPRSAQGLWRRSLEVLSDRELWRVAAVLAAKPVLIVVMLAVGLAPLLFAAALLGMGVESAAGLGHLEYAGPLRTDVPAGLLLCALSVPAGIVALAVLDGIHAVLGTAVRALLAPRGDAAPGPVRELLAESLGDRTLSIAYWLPDRGAFVDEAGRPVELPEPGSGRAWTAVERDGRRVAAIVHDAALDAGPDLVTAAAAAASLAIDNERLKADLRARVEELRVSRLRIVEAGDLARRRLERDLHDGAQQQLVSLALDLRLLRAQLDDGQAAMVDALAAKLSDALAELRELARGIHPAILTERGLGPAIEALAERAAVPVTQEVWTSGRPPAPLEAAAYFVVAEALTNVAKYAQAPQTRVRVSEEDSELVVEVADDGVGGADVSRGTGLRGMADRVAALDGTLELDSPAGGGTRLRARFPMR